MLVWRYLGLTVFVAATAAVLLVPRGPAARSALRTTSDVNWGAVDLSDWSSEDCVTLLMDELSDATDRAQAVNILVARGQSSLPALHGLLSHPSPGVRRRAAIAVGRLGPLAASSLPRMLELTQDPDSGVLIPALEGAAHIDPRNPKVLSIVLEAITSSDGMVQRGASNVLLAIVQACPDRSSEFEPILVQCLNSPHVPVRLAAVSGLAAFSPPRVERLAALLPGTDQPIVFRSMTCLAALGAAAAPAVPELLKLAAATDRMESGFARRVLFRLAPDLTQRLCEAILEPEPIEYRLEAALILAVAAPDRQAAVLPTLLAAVESRGTDARTWSRVHMAFWRMGSPAAALAEWSESKSPQVRDLAHSLRRKATSEMQLAELWIDDLEHGPAPVRARPAYLLGQVPVEASEFYSRLLPFRRDPDPAVRAAVDWTISQIDRAVGPLRSLRVQPSMTR